MKAKLGLEIRTSPTQEVQLICNCCGQPYYPNKSWEDRMRAIIFGAEKYSVCPLCTQEVQSDVFQDEGYRKRCQREVARLQQMFEVATKARRK
jgi:hypothetical protein